MKYAFLIYHDEAASLQATEAESQAMMAEYYAFGDELNAAGIPILGGDALHPTGAATTVRVRDGKTLTSDGPFAETKEQLGGFYILDCENLDEAIKWAAKIPDVRRGSVEIRPLWVFE